jgi:hypothetical protein
VPRHHQSERTRKRASTSPMRRACTHSCRRVTPVGRGRDPRNNNPASGVRIGAVRAASGSTRPKGSQPGPDAGTKGKGQLHHAAGNRPAGKANGRQVSAQRSATRMDHVGPAAKSSALGSIAKQQVQTGLEAGRVQGD